MDNEEFYAFVSEEYGSAIANKVSNLLSQPPVVAFCHSHGMKILQNVLNQHRVPTHCGATTTEPDAEMLT